MRRLLFQVHPDDRAATCLAYVTRADEFVTVLIDPVSTPRRTHS